MYMLYVEKLRVKVSVIIVMRSFSISNLRKIQQHEFPVILMSHFPFVSIYMLYVPFSIWVHALYVF